ncbi:MAG TPA: hypothetical protein VMS22_18480 [Candidatus Eisenbacteria bacterium]|nr:hypothetical protein [Candidatus Eisenbacteria bacterium]
MGASGAREPPAHARRILRSVSRCYWQRQVTLQVPLAQPNAQVVPGGSQPSPPDAVLSPHTGEVFGTNDASSLPLFAVAMSSVEPWRRRVDSVNGPAAR